METIGIIAAFLWAFFCFCPQFLGRAVADVRFGFDARLRELRGEDAEKGRE